MKALFCATIGRPRLHLKDEATGLSLDLEPPRETMISMVVESARWLLHNGTDEERSLLATTCKEIADILA